MTEIALVVLSIAVLVLGIVSGGTIIWARRETVERVSAQEDKLVFEKKSNDLEDQRDAAKAFQVRAEAERDQARAQAEVWKADALKAREELAKHVREKLVTGSDDDVAAEVDRLLGAPRMPAVPGAEGVPPVQGETSGDDHRPPSAG